MMNRTDIPKQDMDQNTDLDAEDPYRGLKILEKAILLILILFIGFIFLMLLSGTAFSSGEEWTPNADFS
jgi:hypothetical protein|tara:strand:- start:1286 stop:1492 length:207 start_codon:yes stop_codon:yes gene_type:complete